MSPNAPQYLPSYVSFDRIYNFWRPMWLINIYTHMPMFVYMCTYIYITHTAIM